MKKSAWFEVDKDGLAKLLERRGKAFVLHELIQNAWDTNATCIDVTLTPIEGRPAAELVVEDDDPDGFKDLAHAFTLFAESEKKDDPEKRGRFNIGEKLVLALCEKAQIESTSGAVMFDADGRHRLTRKREHGSCFRATIRMTREDISEALAATRTLLPPAGKTTTLNGADLTARIPVKEFSCALPTEIADGEGVLRRSARTTTVEIHPVREGETASVYELGIPVVETGDKYHYNVMQKVPLNADRDNVTPAYLRQLRTESLNQTHDLLEEKDASEGWVRDAAGDERATGDAVERVMDLRFGKKRVVYDPSDPEGTKLAMSQGYTVIPPRALSRDEWRNVREHEAAKPAGQVTPSPKPFSADGEPLEYLDKSKWTDAMKRVVAYTQEVGTKLLGFPVAVDIASKVTWPYGATFGSGHLIFNLGRLGHEWFNDGPSDKTDRLLIHEFGHHFSGDHLSEDYHKALCRLGAKLAKLAIEDPKFFKRHGRGA